jgi:hypothetical protein
MIRFAFLASQVYQTHAIETRYTIASFLPCFLPSCSTIVCLLPSLFQSGQSSASSFLPFLAQSLFLSWLLCSSRSMYINVCSLYFHEWIDRFAFHGHVPLNIRIQSKRSNANKSNQANLEPSPFIAPHLLF